MNETLFKIDWREIWHGLPVPESGSVYTKPAIVSLILDLAGYVTSEGHLSHRRILEPSCGDGAFLTEILTRLLASESQGTDTFDWHAPAWNTAVLAVDIDQTVLEKSRSLIVAMLVKHGCPIERARQLGEMWTVHTDFLLHDWGRTRFDFVVGNPPYVRLEEIPAPVLWQYRNKWRTAIDRADLYIPFFECGLTLLSQRGALAFICANRFAKNQYGAALRRLIAGHYHVRHYINLEHTHPFLTKVSAYPAIIVIDRQRGEPTHAETVDDLLPETLNTLRQARSASRSSRAFKTWYPNGAPWLSTSRTRKASLDALTKAYPTLEESSPGTHVGIGIATGADHVFVLKEKDADIESDRQVPLLMAGDISNTDVAWSGHYLVNPFADADDGTLVNLKDFPGLSRYLNSHGERLRARHCAISRPRSWYRTIDRFWPALTKAPKLVIPDIQPGGIVGYDGGGLYPHHNVYWITSATWDLRELQRVLQSDMVTDQLRAFSVAMRGGSLRYQAQYLRRLRIPPPISAASLS